MIHDNDCRNPKINSPTNPKKSRAYATDWDSHASSPQGISENFSADNIMVSSYDIYSGLEEVNPLPRALAETEGIFLGKGGSLLDRHSAPALQTLSKIQKVLDTLSWKKPPGRRFLSVYYGKVED